ncbi:hypothetical protein KDW99_08670 [Marinomonas rhizomae]|uniref:hypothetical protein n=1 Tax=Marinomonas rhizomae TaxID=491948 RepID=UPI00210655C5|nr:hypothetical protein [Marinomonas rhizomae]UTW01180.1 hypothetical protein KDW99_08670 [Marinomonas rhizomae]
MVCRFEMTLKQSDDRIDLYGFDGVVMQLKALKEIAAMAVLSGRGKVFLFIELFGAEEA